LYGLTTFSLIDSRFLALVRRFAKKVRTPPRVRAQEAPVVEVGFPHDLGHPLRVRSPMAFSETEKRACA